MKNRKPVVLITLALMIMVGAPAVARAQAGGVQGQVVVVKPDGTKEPVENVLIELYRLDVKGQYRIKTNKKGQFAHIGLPYGTYAILLSGKGLTPFYEMNVRIPPGGAIERTYEMTPGDGRRLTLEEVQQHQTQAGQPPTLPPEEQQKMMEEALKKQKEQQAAAARDEGMIKHFEAGKQLASNSQFDEAIRQYTLALHASPDHPQLYVIQGKMAEAYFNQGVTRNNSGQRQPAIESFALAAETARRAADMVPADKTTERPLYLKLYAQAMGVSARFDNSRVDDAVAAYEQLMALQPPAERTGSKVKIAEIYNDAGRSDEAISVYQQILEEDPNNLDALYGLGQAYAASPDPANYPEAIKILEQYVKQASKDKAQADKVEQAKVMAQALKEFIKQQK